MTEPDEALLWAREDFAKQFRSRRSNVADSILSGFWDIEVEVSLPAHGYRAGAAASAERIKALEAAIQQADKRLQDYADMTVDQAAASAARVAELEAALRDALPHLEACFRHHVWRNEPMPEPGYLKNIRALLKDPDQ